MVPEEEDELVVPETRGASRPHEAPTPAPASVLVKPKYHRRIPMPARGVHPSWSKQASTDDSTCIERARDRVLGLLTQPLFSAWTLVGIVHSLAIIGVGAWFFFLLVDGLSPFRNFGLTDDAREVFMNAGLQALTALFTFSALLTMPWRLSNATHLTYNTGRDSCNTCAGRLCCAAGKPRSCAPGLDFYGKPTESIWFHIPTFHRRAIVSLQIVNTFAQFMAQAARIVYNSFELQDSYPGNVWCMAPFFTSMGAGLIAEFYKMLQAAAALAQAPTLAPTPTLAQYQPNPNNTDPKQERRLRREEPERFPPGPLEDIALSYRSWRRGLWTIIPRGKHHHERVRYRAPSPNPNFNATSTTSLNTPRPCAVQAALHAPGPTP